MIETKCKYLFFTFLFMFVWWGWYFVYPVIAFLGPCSDLTRSGSLSLQYTALLWIWYSCDDDDDVIFLWNTTRTTRSQSVKVISLLLLWFLDYFTITRLSINQFSNCPHTRIHKTWHRIIFASFPYEKSVECGHFDL